MEYTIRNLSLMASAAVAVILTPILIGGAFENLDATEIMVVQAPVSGELTVHTEQGLKWQGWGHITKYPRRVQYSFSAAKDQSKGEADLSIQTGFNDGGKGKISGAE